MKLRILSLLLLGGLAAAQGVIVGGGDVVYDPKTGEYISCLEKPKNPRQAKLCWPGFPPFALDEFHAAAEFKAADMETTVGWERLKFNQHTHAISAPKTRPAKAVGYVLWIYAGPGQGLVYEGLRTIKRPVPKELR